MIDKLKLAPEQTLRHEGSVSKGFMGETDVTTYSVLDASGNVVGTVVHTAHTAVRGLRVTNSVVQKDLHGTILVKKNW